MACMNRVHRWWMFRLTACDGNSDSLSSSRSPSLNIDFSRSKHFDFSWQAVRGAERYRVLENPDGQSGAVYVFVNDARCWRWEYVWRLAWRAVLRVMPATIAHQLRVLFICLPDKRISGGNRSI